MSLSLEVCRACYEQHEKRWRIEDNQRWLFYGRVRCACLPLREFPRESAPSLTSVPTMQELLATPTVKDNEEVEINQLPSDECPFSAEHAVMTDHEIGADVDGAPKQLDGGGNRHGHLPDFRAALHLQALRPEIRNRADVQQLVQEPYDAISLHLGLLRIR